jgi:hypothetical protein
VGVWPGAGDDVCDGEDAILDLKTIEEVRSVVHVCFNYASCIGFMLELNVCLPRFVLAKLHHMR